MAEQEACASAVTDALAAAGEATDGGDGVEPRGESLLLPLLQGLLGGGGERLLAGLGAAPADVVADVRRSLARLRAALAPPADHPQARALLSLADRLEDALDAADRLDGCKKKSRRRSRAARHTVGVTHEELEEARRLVDRDQLALGSDRPEPVSSGAASTVTSTEEAPTPERKPSVDDEISYHDAIASRHKQPPVAHSVSYEPAPTVNRDAHVVERRAPTARKPEFHRHSLVEPGQQFDRGPPEPRPQPRPQPHPQPRPQPPSYQPQPQPHPQPLQPRMERRTSDTRSSIAAIANKFDSQAQKDSAPIRRAPVEQPSPPVQMRQNSQEEKKRAPLYRPLPASYNFAAPPATDDITKPLNRFNNNKRLRMKRANTIDIGRPLGGYRIDSDTDEENGPHRRPIVPEFQPQTENDKKFVAFMKKNEANEREGGQANWSNRFGNIKHAFESRERDVSSRSSSSSSARHFWRTAEEAPLPAAGAPRPRKFIADTNAEAVKPPWATDRREPSRTQMSRQVPPPPPPVPVAPPPAVASRPPPALPPVPQSPTRPLVVKPFVARPIPVNQFSHAPMSAFKPPTKITSPTSAPVHIWSPPSINNVVSPTSEIPASLSPNPKSITPSPPVPSVPWATGESDKPRRTVGLTAAKFENTKYDVNVVPTPKREKPSAFRPLPPNHISLQSIPAQSQNYASPQQPPQQSYYPPQNHVPLQQIDYSPQNNAPTQQTQYPQQNYPLPPQTQYQPQNHALPQQTRYQSQNHGHPQQTHYQTQNHSQETQNHGPPQQYIPQEYTPPYRPHEPAPQSQNYSLRNIPSQNNLAAPELVRKIDDVKRQSGTERFPPHVDAQRLQIEFYERQIRDKNRREVINENNGEPGDGKAAPPAYTVTDYTPTGGVSTFVPLQRTPDIEKARAHKVDYLPDVVTNETERPVGVGRSPQSPRVYQNGDAHVNGSEDGVTTEHSSVVTRVMRGPQRGAATITAGVRTRADDERRAPAADSLRGALDKFSSPKRDVLAQIERKKRETARSQVPPPVRSPLPASAPHAPSSPGLGASRESIASSESIVSPASGPLSRSGSWHQIPSPKPTSPRRVVSRAKSMHLLAVPKMYEGGISRDELTDKKRSVEAYFSGRSTNVTAAARTASGRPRAPRPAATQPYSLGRSRTMPTVSELQFLDESNADDAFEDLVSALA